MTGFHWALLVYTLLFGLCDVAVWLLYGSVEILDGPRIGNLSHEVRECFLAMSDEVLLFDGSDDGASERVLRDVAPVNLDRHEAGNA